MDSSSRGNNSNCLVALEIARTSAVAVVLVVVGVSVVTVIGT